MQMTSNNAKRSYRENPVSLINVNYGTTDK